VLRAGELLLDLYLGPESSLLFAVTREEIRAVRLPADDAMGDLCSLTRDVVGTPPDAAGAHVDPAVRERTLSSVAHRLLDPVGDLLQSSSMVFVSPDACLQDAPLALLIDRSARKNAPTSYRPSGAPS